MTKDMDVETAAQIAAVAFARDLMVSNLGQMPYESEFGELKLEAVWGPTACRDSKVNRMSESQPQTGQSDCCTRATPSYLTF
jgi:hypothetical protein